MPEITDSMEPTCDPNVFIEEKREAYIRYYRVTDGQRWEVIGTCTNIGNCWIGAVGPRPVLDCPVGPFGWDETSCCPLHVQLL